MLVDLTAKKSKVETISEEFCKKYVGGIGLSARFLLDYTSPKIDPLSADNVLTFATGPFTGTLVPCSGNHGVVAKSPLTQFIGDSVPIISSSFWSVELKRTGHDALIIKGRSEKPSYLFIDDDEVYFEEAKDIWGKDCFETDKLIKEELEDVMVRVATIGLAGENAVRIANLSNDRRRGCRCGLGAVMGSKNLKAIAVRGTKTVNVAHMDRLTQICSELAEKAQSPATSKYRVVGTPSDLLAFNETGNLPTRNWQQATFEMAEKVSGEYILENYVTNIVACSSCPIACDHNCALTEGLYAGTAASIDYESLFAFGPLCGVGNFPSVLKAIELCDYYGLDTNSTGGVIAWTIECYEKGILSRKDVDGLELNFGNEDACIQLIHKIARREGVGDLLGQGSKRAAEKIGKGSEHFAMHIKGLELPGYDIRGLRTAALSWAVAARGGDPNSSGAYDVDTKGGLDRLKADTDPSRIVVESEDEMAVFDSLILCKFVRGCFQDFYTEASQLYTLVTGLEMKASELKSAGERIVNLKKAYNMREGWTRRDDRLPPRIMKDPTSDGKAKGSRITEEELNLLLDNYYAARGWTKEGFLPKQKLIELQLNDLAKAVGV